jgi:putative solute:sodium symporter small subunit
MQNKKDSGKAYWHTTLKLLGVILILWVATSFGASIFFAEQLNEIKLGGFPLGFWFSQQGSIYIFIALIFVYIKIMGKIDKKYDVHEK